MPLYAGFDCSTQSLTTVVIDTDRRSVVFRGAQAFEEPWRPSADPAVVHADPRTWVSALEAGLVELRRHIDVRQLRAISGAAQQHGSVYCGEKPDVLTRETAPIWMDSSTTKECEEIERALGGPGAVAQLTGSRAHSRFTGPQIRKFALHNRDAYQRTRRIHLVSSYLASVLCGDHVAADHADASGMNLMDIRTREWSAAALDATAPDLLSRLPPLLPSSSVIGILNAPWQRRLAWPPVRIVVCSGDNPSSLVGAGLLQEGQLAVSLGTSDTIFGPMSEPRVSIDGTGHVFASPLGAYMGITVFRNGSLARDRVRQDWSLTWEGFSAALRNSPPGNHGAMMLPWFEPEITPSVPRSQICRVGLEEASAARHVRAIVEAQAMALYRHSKWMGVVPYHIRATGGAAANQEILQIAADVFNTEVVRFESTDSAALGAALRAYQADVGLPWPEVADGFVNSVPDSCISPVPEHAAIYRDLLSRHAALEAQVLAQQ